MSYLEHTYSTEVLKVSGSQLPGCRLVVIGGDDVGATIELPAGAITVGKSSSADLKLRDSAVSAKHARFEVSDGGIRVTDLGSTNGTRYLGERIGEALLAPGAVVTLGRTRVAVVSREPTGSADYSQRADYAGILGAAPAMRRLYALLERLEATDYTVLIDGETGSGKDVVARAIHQRSTRRDKPLIVFDCGAVARNLVASELFGHARGAFTGAEAARDGVFTLADGGTLFIDEIGELPLDLQPKLLRVLEERELRVLGSDEVKRVDVRVIAATNRNLDEEVRAGRFREDLFFRLNVVRVAVPPLRERREDIPTLLRHFVRLEGGDELSVSQATTELFTSAYDWPGNVRELRNAVTRVLSLGSLPPGVRDAPSKPQTSTEMSFNDAKKRLVDAFEHDYLAAQLSASQGNLARAARASGVDRAYFKRLLRRHGLLPDRGDK